MNFTRWVVAPRAKPTASARLFCFPHAGAGSAAYRGWADVAGADLDVRLVQLPGRENRLREPALTSVEDVVSGLMTELEPLTDLPFAFFGHSMGAIVAFETARHLRRTGGPLPMSMFVSASRAPQLPWPHAPVRKLDDLALLKTLNQRYNSVPEIVIEDADLRELLTPALRADMTIVETYAYRVERPFDFPVIAFGGHDDRMVRHPELQQWDIQTTAPFRLRMLDGDHLFLQDMRQVLLAEIADAMRIQSDRFVSPVVR